MSHNYEFTEKGLKRFNYEFTEEGLKRFEAVKRFRDQKGRLGVSSEYLYRVLLFFSGKGEVVDLTKPECPWDADDFSRIGILIILRPDLEKHLLMVKGCSPIWYNIVEYWDELCDIMFFNEGDNHRINDLYKEIVSRPVPPGIEFYDGEIIPSSKHKEDNVAKEENVATVVKSIDDEELATQLVDNVDAIQEMKISPDVAKELIPRLIRKMFGRVNLTWTWDPSENNKEKEKTTDSITDGWQEIYRSGEQDYDIPRNDIPGHLQVNVPIVESVETRDLCKMCQAWVDAESNRATTDEEDLQNAIRLIEAIEKGGYNPNSQLYS